MGFRMHTGVLAAVLAIVFAAGTVTGGNQKSHCASSPGS